MSTYFGKFSIDDAPAIPVGSTLYGICSSTIDATTKVVTLSNFDELQNGVTVHVKFINGNSAPLNSSFRLQVGSTPAQFIKNPGGSVAWSSGAVVSFTYDSSDHSWIANDGTSASVAILNAYDPTSEQGISGKGVADALDDLGTASTKNSTTYIGNGNQNSNDVLPTVYAVTRYVDSKIGSGTGGSGSGESNEGSDPDALHYIGITTTNIASAPSTNPIIIEDSEVTAELNDIVATNNNKKYIWLGHWELFIDEDSYGIRMYRQTEGYNQDLPLIVSRSDAASIGVVDQDDSYTNNIYGVIWNDTTKTPTVNIATGTLKASIFSGSGAQLTNINAESIASGTLPLARLADSGADAGTYGPDTNLNANYDDTFEVPQISVDAKGRVTFAAERTIHLPASDNTDANVLQEEVGDDYEYPILIKHNHTFTNETAGTKFAGENKLVTINPSLGRITAEGGFVGTVSEATVAQTARSIEWTNIQNRPSLNIAGIPFGLNDALSHTITAYDLRVALGLQNALHFIGVFGTSNDEFVLPDEYVPQSGDVILVEGFEYIYVETNAITHAGGWEKLGDDTSFKLKQTAIVDDPDHTVQNAITFVSHISQNIHGVIDVTKSQLPFAAADMFGIVSMTEQSFSGLKHFLNGIDVKTSASNANTIHINGTSIQATGANDAASILYLQSNGGTIFIGEDNPAYLLMTGASQFDGNVGIGTTPENQTTGHLHRLKVNGSILILDDTTQVAHLDVTTLSNQKILQFFPHTANTGLLGTLEQRWESLYLANEIIIGNNGTDGFIATSSGIVTLTGTTPTITLNNDNSTWTINTSGVALNITNTSSSIQGNGYGFKINNCLFINEDIPTNIALLQYALFVNGNSIFNGIVSIQEQIESTTFSNGALIVAGGAGIAKNVNIGGKVGIGTTIDTNINDPHQLVVQGSILIKTKSNDSVYAVAHLDANTITQDVNTYGQLVFYPEEPEIGYIGTNNNKWNSGYFSNLVYVANSNLVGTHINGDGTIELISSTEAAITFVDGTTNWKISDSSMVISIASLYHNNTYINGYSNNGFIVSPRLAINGIINSNYELTVHGNTYITDQLGVGTTAQTDVALSVNDYIKLMHGQNDILHIQYEEYGNLSVLSFYPEAAEQGTIGTPDHRWKTLYLSEDFNITNSNDNEIGLHAATGAITITAVTPALNLIPLDTELTSWTISDIEGIFTITNNDGVYIRGLNDLGFAIYPRLYISDTVDNAGTYNLYVAGEENNIGNIQLYGYTGIGTFSDQDRTPLESERSILTVQSSIKFTNDIDGNHLNDVGYLGYYTREINDEILEQFDFYTKDRIGFLGKAEKRWKRLYLYEGIDIRDEYNNNGDDYIILSTTIDNGSQFILSSDRNNCNISMSTAEGSDAALSMTSSGAGNSSIISLTSENTMIEMITSAQNSDLNWTIQNNGQFSITNGSSSTLLASNNGFCLSPRFYLNATMGENPTYIFLIENPDNNVGLSKFNTTLGIGAESGNAYLAVQNYIKLVHEGQGVDNPDLTHWIFSGTEVRFYPEKTGKDYIGLDTNRWHSLYLSDIISLKQTINGSDNSISLSSRGASIVLTAPIPSVQFVSTAGAAPSWTISNIGSSKALMIQDAEDKTHIRMVSNYGVEIQKSLCIRNPNATNPVSIEATSSYGLYVDGDIHLTGGINVSNNIFPTIHESQNNGRADVMWRSLHSVSIAARFINAASPQHRHNSEGDPTDTTDSSLYLGYYDAALAGTHAIFPTKAIRLYYSDGVGRNLEQLRVNENGVYILRNLIVGNGAVANANYDLVVAGPSQLLGGATIGGHSYFLGMNPTYDIGSYPTLAVEPVSNMLRTLYTQNISVKFIDAAPEDQNSLHEIFIGYFNIAESNNHAITPTEIIHFYSSSADLVNPVAPVEQMRIDANGTFIFNDVTMGDSTADADKTINFLGTDAAIKFLHKNSYNYMADHSIAMITPGIIFIGSGDTIIEKEDEISVLSNDAIKQNIFLVADGSVVVAANAQGDVNNRNGFQISIDKVLPIYHGVVQEPFMTSNIDPNSGTNNQLLMGMSLGSETARWRSLFVGTQNTYGGQKKLFWWNNGVPEDSTVSTDPLYPLCLDHGELQHCGYMLASNIDPLHPVEIPPSGGNEEVSYDYTHHKLAYYTFNNLRAPLITPAIISTDGAYLEDVSHLFITGNGGNYTYSDTNYKLAVQGKTLLTDNLVFYPLEINQVNVPQIQWDCTGTITDPGSDTQISYESGASVYYKVSVIEVSGQPTVINDGLHIDLKYSDTANVVFGTQSRESIYINNASGCIYPSFTNPGTLGLGGANDVARRWSGVFIGTANTYGDDYTPIWWNNGVPKNANVTIQIPFTINKDKVGVKLTHASITSASYVTEIVVQSGEGNLTSAIEWESDNGFIELRTAAVSNKVQGYIMVSRGARITATMTDLNPSS